MPTAGEGSSSFGSPKLHVEGQERWNNDVFVACGLNVCSSVGVIVANKSVFRPPVAFHFGTTLTVIHFVFNFAVCYAMMAAGVVAFKRVPLLKVLPLSLAFAGYVVFNNLSLLYNSVCIYQLAKIACTPAIVLIETIFYKKQKSRQVLVSLVPTCLGVGVSVYQDPEISVIGLVFAALAIVSNSLYTIWGHTNQKDLNVQPMQLLFYQAPLAAILLVFTVPFFDDWRALVQYEWTGQRALLVMLTATLGFGVNFSFFLGVSRTSSLTMNLLGHLKTVLVFVGGWLLFGEALTAQKLAGICITMAGLVMYSNAKTAPRPAARAAEDELHSPSAGTPGARGRAKPRGDLL